MNIFGSMGKLSVPGKRFSLVAGSGRVFDQKEWTETDVHTSGGYASGNYYHAPTTTVTTTKKGELFMIDHNGKEQLWKITEVHGIRPGHVLTKYGPGDAAYWFGIYNHNLDTFTTFNSYISYYMKPSAIVSWVIALLLAFVATYNVSLANPMTSIGENMLVFSGFLLLMGLIVWILHALITYLRRTLFKMRYQKRIEALVRENAAIIESQLPDRIVQA